MIERVYHPWWEREEVGANMWGSVDNRAEFLQKAIEFTGNAELYGHYMLRVCDEWPKSSQHNLSNTTQNRRAWIGHAACALAMGCPEDIVRQAWGHLTEWQQRAANQKADEAIQYWEQNHAEKEIRNECFRCREFANSQNIPMF